MTSGLSRNVCLLRLLRQNTRGSWLGQTLWQWAWLEANIVLHMSSSSSKCCETCCKMPLLTLSQHELPQRGHAAVSPLRERTVIVLQAQTAIILIGRQLSGQCIQRIAQSAWPTHVHLSTFVCLRDVEHLCQSTPCSTGRRNVGRPIFSNHAWAPVLLTLHQRMARSLRELLLLLGHCQRLPGAGHAGWHDDQQRGKVAHGRAATSRGASRHTKACILLNHYRFRSSRSKSG